MKFGHFDDKRREYVITNPRTPYPWINYLGCEEFFSIITNSAGGYSFYKDARLRRITRYRYNNVPVDDGGKYFYINENGKVWSPGWKPVKRPLDRYECRHGMGYSVLTGEVDQLEAEVLYMVPIGYRGEVQRVKLTNHSNRKRSFSLFSFVEWCLWDALDDASNFQRNFSTGQVEIEGSTIYHKTEYRERRDHYAFYTVNEPVEGLDTDRESFLGLYNGFDAPDAVMECQSRNSHAHGWSPIASHQLKIELEPGEEKQLVFVLGYVEVPVADKFSGHQVINKAPAEKMISQFQSGADVEKAFAELGQFWDNLLSVYQLEHPEEKLNRAVKALESVKERLDCEYGIVLNNPAFTSYIVKYGEISSYPEGYKENAGIFCHNNPWIMIAETLVGNGDAAWEYFKKICPPYLEEISDLHKTEPYVYSQMIAGKDAHTPGEAKNSWLTGTAAWNFYAISQYILGIKPDFEGLRIHPVIPAAWEGYRVTRKFRGVTYQIEVTNPDHVSSGVKELLLNGDKATGNLIPVCETGTTNKVQVVMG